MAFEKPDVPAFKHGLNDNYVVRRATERFHAENFDAKEYAIRSKSAFDKLRERGINVPAQLVVADNEKDSTGKGADVFVITDKIDHLPIENLGPEEKTKAGEEFHNVPLALVGYYENTFETRSDFLADLSEREQYVYGTKRGAAKAEWYLVDTDPILYDDLASLADNVLALEEELPDIEEEFSIKFSDVRKRAKYLLKKLNEVD
jgi:hypothetical protein